MAVEQEAGGGVAEGDRFDFLKDVLSSFEAIGGLVGVEAATGDVGGGDFAAAFGVVVPGGLGVGEDAFPGIETGCELKGDRAG